MKYIPVVGVSILFAACATQVPSNVQPVGKSANAPQDVAQCIAKRWADKTQQTITSQTTIANNLGVDVLMPGAAPGGNAAVVRPSLDGKGAWVGIRSTGGAPVSPDAASDINSCL
ncbi:MAG: hypothetical protein ACRYG5_17035 [Janthinobacterium lividum]